MPHPWVSITAALVVSLVASAAAPASEPTDLVASPGPGSEWTGTVFVDANANGERDPGEAPRAGVRVSNGLEVQTTGADGRYAFADTADGFVRITRPAEFSCERWHRRDPGDFALVPRAASDAFFFIQITDMHAYAEASDFARYSLADAPSWIPSRIGAYAMMWLMWTYYDGLTHSQISAHFAEALEPRVSTRGLSDSEVLIEYMKEFERPGSSLGDVVAAQRAAIDEVAALAPAFVINTGDLVLEGNTAPGEAVEPWFELYDELTSATGIPFYDTIGNNEITASKLDSVPATDPRYGKRLFERFRGPTTFSFDRGPFHFAVADTHVEIPSRGSKPTWEFELLDDRIDAWLDADLVAHSDRVLVVLNHEPFHSLPDWSFYDPVDDRGLLAKHRVPYSIGGHIHMNGIEVVGDTTHITTGALSGMRWIVPPSLHRRGYRLFYARDRRLYSAWKEIGKPVVAFVHPLRTDAAFPTGTPPPPASGGTPVVAVAADAGGAFHSLELRASGAPLPFERWGDYFLYAELPPGADPTGLEVIGVRSDGSRVAERLSPTPR